MSSFNLTTVKEMIGGISFSAVIGFKWRGDGVGDPSRDLSVGYGYTTAHKKKKLTSYP